MPENPQEPARILVIRLSALGDVANTLPAVAALRRALPGARIGWLTQAPSNELISCANVADEIILYPRERLGRLWRRPWRWPRALIETLGFARELRARGFTCSLDFQGNLKGGLLALASGARDRIGFARGHCREGDWLFNNILAMPSSRRMLRADKHLCLAQALAPDLEPTPVELCGSEEEAKQVEAFVADLERPLFALQPGTSEFGRFKRWPVERFGELARRLTDLHRATCIVTWGPGERDLAEQVCERSQGSARPAPELSIGGLVELLRRVDLFVAGDTGPVHIAALLDRPLVAILGPKDPAVYAPCSDSALVVRKDIECSPCTRRTCDHVSCIMEIAVEEVIEGVERVLSGRTQSEAAASTS